MGAPTTRAACTAASHRALATAPRAAWLANTRPLYTGQRPVAMGLEHADCPRCGSTICRRVACLHCGKPADGMAEAYCSPTCERADTADLVVTP